MFPLCEQTEGAINAKVWEVRTVIDGEFVSYHEVYFRFGYNSPILRLHQSDLTSLQSVVSRIMDALDTKDELEDFDRLVTA